MAMGKLLPMTVRFWEVRTQNFKWVSILMLRIKTLILMCFCFGTTEIKFIITQNGGQILMALRGIVHGRARGHLPSAATGFARGSAVGAGERG